jgi:hypothetical protein
MNADADDLRHITKQCGYSPAANEYISLLSQPEDFFGCEARQLSLVNLPPLEDRGGTLEIPLKSAFFDAKVGRNIARNNFRTYDLES